MKLQLTVPEKLQPQILKLVDRVKVKQNKREAKAVYEAFKRWMTHAIMSGELNQ